MAASRAVPGLWIGVGLLVLTGAMLTLLLLDEPGEGSGQAGTSGALPILDASGEDTRPMDAPAGQEGSVSSIDVDVPDAPAEPAPLAATRQVSGRIRRLADDSAVGGRSVRSLQHQTTTDAAAGTFALDAVGEAETELLLALGERLVRVPLPDRAGDLLDLDLVVDTGWVLPGVVRTSRGAPVSGARLRCGGLEVESDAVGRFRLVDVAPDRNRPTALLHASAPMHAATRLAVALRADRRVLQAQEVVLEPGGALFGWAIPPAGETPRSTTVRAPLRLGRDGVQRAIKLPDTRTALDGAYRVDGLPAGRYLVTVGDAPPDGEVLRELQYLGDQQQDPARDDEQRRALEALLRSSPVQWVSDVTVVEGQETRLDITLPAGAVVRGRITDAAGNPLGGAEVDGVRVLRHPVPEATGGAAALIDGLEVTVDDGPAPTARISARVATAVTDDSGAFVLGALPAGEVVLTARHADHPGWAPSERVLQIAVGGTTNGIDLVLGGGLVVRGRVFDARGQPARGAQVMLLPAQGAAVYTEDDRIATGADGRFEFAGLEGGSLRLHVDLAGHVSWNTLVEPSPVEQRVELVVAPVLRGVVRDVRTGQPVPEFRVRIQNETMQMSSSMTDEGGRFEVDTLEEGLYSIIVEAPGYRPTRVDGVRPVFGEGEVVIQLQPNG